MILALMLFLLFTNLILMSHESVDEEKKREENLHPFAGNPSCHGSQSQQQSITSDTKSSSAISVLHKKIETYSLYDPSYPNGGALF